MKRLTENQIVEKLQAMEIRPLNINCRAVEPYLPFGDYQSKYRPDALFDISWKAKTYRFVAEIKTVSTPKFIDEAIWQLTSYLEFFKNRQSEETYYPLIVAPYLNDRTLAELSEREISGIDLSGNLLLIVPEQLFFSRTGKPNKYPSDDPIKNVYRSSSSIVARVFLSKPQFGSVSDVYDEIISRGAKISLGTVSKVLKTMEEDLLISRNAGIRLIDPRRLLSKLVENYRKKVTRQIRARVTEIEMSLAQLAYNCDRKNLRYAVDEPQRYADFPTVGAPLKLYLENIDAGLEDLDFEETDRFSNVQIMETSEPSNYFDRELDNGVYYTSDVQTYLDLMKGGKREQEVAEQLAERLLARSNKAQ